MYCEECRVSVDTDFNICPLCHAPLVEIKTGDVSNLPVRSAADSTVLNSTNFPKSSPRKKFISYIPITSVFLGLFLPIIIMCLVLDIMLFASPSWSLILGSVILIGYITIRNTILSDCGFGMRISYLLFGFILFFYALQTLFPTIGFASSITLPALISLALIANSILLAFKGNYHGSLYVSSLLFSLLSLLPLILAVSGLISLTITIIITAIFGVFGIISTIILGRGKLWTYFKMVFHN